MAAASAMETNGVPIDVPTLEMLRAHWTNIKEQLITDIAGPAPRAAARRSTAARRTIPRSSPN
jgi:hypothetical protein